MISPLILLQTLPLWVGALVANFISVLANCQLYSSTVVQQFIVFSKYYCKRPRQLTTGRQPFAKLVSFFVKISGQTCGNSFFVKISGQTFPIFLSRYQVKLGAIFFVKISGQTWGNFFVKISGQGQLQFSLIVVLTFSTLQAFKLATLGIVTQGPLQCIKY